MVLDILAQLSQTAQAFLIPIPLDNILAKLYVVLDLLAKLFLAGNAPATDPLDFLPF